MAGQGRPLKYGPYIITMLTNEETYSVVEVRNLTLPLVNAVAREAGEQETESDVAHGTLSRWSSKKFGISQDEIKLVGTYRRNAWLGWRWKVPIAEKFYDNPADYHEVQRLHREWIQSELDRKQEEQRKKEQERLEQERREERERLEQGRREERERLEQERQAREQQEQRERERDEERERERKKRRLYYRRRWIWLTAIPAFIFLIVIASPKKRIRIAEETPSMYHVLWIESKGRERNAYWFRLTEETASPDAKVHTVLAAIPP